MSRPRGSLNHLHGAFLPDFLGPIIFPCLVPSLYLADLRILLRVRSHLSAKVDSSKEAYGVGIIHYLTSKEFFCACVVGMISVTSRMRSILSLLLFGRAQPLLLSSCYLSLRASILRRQTPAAEPGASLSLPHTFHPLGSPLSPRHRAQPAPSPNKQPCFTSVNLPMSLPERDDAIGHVKGKRALSIVQLQRQQATSGRGLAAGTKPRAQPAPLCWGWLRATRSPVSPPGAGKGARETGPKLQSEKKSISC